VAKCAPWKGCVATDPTDLRQRQPRFTEAADLGRDIGGDLGVRMPLASGERVEVGPTLRAHVREVRGLGVHEQVLWPDARGVVAAVADDEALTDLAMGNEPGEAVGQRANALRDGEAAVRQVAGRSALTRAGPYPALPELRAVNRYRAVSVHAGPKPGDRRGLTRAFGRAAEAAEQVRQRDAGERGGGYHEAPRPRRASRSSSSAIRFVSRRPSSVRSSRAQTTRRTVRSTTSSATRWSRARFATDEPPSQERAKAEA
jgi:hypothetical protein